MGKALRSDAEIIEAGKRLTARYGRNATATEIFKELGGKGNYYRLRDIWDGFLEAALTNQKTAIPIPDECNVRISAALLTLQEAMEGKLFA